MSQCTALDKMLLCRVEVIIVASSVAALGQLKKKKEEEEEDYLMFDPCLFAALERFSSMFFLFLITNVFGNLTLPCMFETNQQA